MKYFISKAEYTNNKQKCTTEWNSIHTHSNPNVHIVVHQDYLDKSNHRDCIAVSTVTVETIVTVETVENTVTVETVRDYCDSRDSRDYCDSRDS